MKDNLFLQGTKVDINTVLRNKDDRVREQARLEKQNPKAVIISIKLNIPGPIKNNKKLTHLFDVGMEEYEEDFLEELPIIQQIGRNRVTGKERMLVVAGSPFRIKKDAIKFEDENPIGRLFDIDVMDSVHGNYSRKEMGLPPRRCFICNKNAKECARNRTHSVEELQDEISDIYWREIRHG